MKIFFSVFLVKSYYVTPNLIYFFTYVEINKRKPSWDNLQVESLFYCTPYEYIAPNY